MADLPPPPPPSLTPPPGYVAYGGPGAAFPGSLRRIGGLSRALAILLVIYLPLQGVALTYTIGVVNDAGKLLDGEIALADFRDTVGGFGALAGGVLVIPIAVLTMIWMFRMASNVRALGRQTTFGPGWGVAAWFVPPGVVYAVPWLMFRELWKASDPERPAHDPGWKANGTPVVVHLWWVLFGLVPLLGLFVGNPLSFGTPNDNSLRDLAERYDRYAGLAIGVAASSIVATAVYLLLVRQLSARHMRATREA